MLKILHYDLETTGKESTVHGVHQVAGYVQVGDKIVDEFDFKVKPHPLSQYDDRALAIAGVTASVVKQYEAGDVIVRRLANLFAKHVTQTDPKDKFFLSGFNICHFDNPFFFKWLTQYGLNFKYRESFFWSAPLDVFSLSAHVLRHERINMHSFDLITVAKRFNIPVVENQLHDAKYDAFISQQIYNKICNLF